VELRSKQIPVSFTLSLSRMIENVCEKFHDKGLKGIAAGIK
jgi:hypothetical protein